MHGLWSLLVNFFTFYFPVCDDACREIVMDPTDEILVCKISGHCFDRLLSAAEMELDTVSINFLYLILPHSWV